MVSVPIFFFVPIFFHIFVPIFSHIFLSPYFKDYFFTKTPNGIDLNEWRGWPASTLVLPPNFGAPEAPDEVFVGDGNRGLTIFNKQTEYPGSAGSALTSRWAFEGDFETETFIDLDNVGPNTRYVLSGFTVGISRWQCTDANPVLFDVLDIGVNNPSTDGTWFLRYPVQQGIFTNQTASITPLIAGNVPIRIKIKKTGVRADFFILDQTTTTWVNVGHFDVQDPIDTSKTFWIIQNSWSFMNTEPTNSFTISDISIKANERRDLQCWPLEPIDGGGAETCCANKKLDATLNATAQEATWNFTNPANCVGANLYLTGATTAVYNHLCVQAWDAGQSVWTPDPGIVSKTGVLDGARTKYVVDISRPSTNPLSQACVNAAGDQKIRYAAPGQADWCPAP